MILSIVRYAVLALCLIVLTASQAVAQDKKPTKEKMKEALELIQGANDDFEGGDYKYALEGYEEAYSIYPSSILLYRLGLTNEKLGNKREAAKFYTQYLEKEPKGSKAKDVKKALEKIGDSLPPIVEIKSDPEGAEVFVDDPNSEPVATTPQAFELEEGEYVFFVKKEGFRVFEVTKEVENGDSISIDAKLEPLKGGTLANDNSLLLDEDEEDEESTSSGLRTWGWVAVGVGAGLIGTGGVFSLLSNSKAVEVNGYNKRSPDASREELEDLKSSANTFYDASLGLYIAGGVLAATGLTLILLDSGSENSETGWKLELQPAKEGAAVSFSTNF